MSNIAESDKFKNKSKEIYLDYAAMAPADPAILQKMLPYYDAQYGNPSSLHRSGRKARQVIEKMRAKIAGIINSLPEEIIFTASGTESDNLAIFGSARANMKKGKHVIISNIDHKAVLESAKCLLRQGFDVSILPVDKHGMINVEQALALVRKDTILISVMLVNNEIGTILPITELSAALSKINPELRPLLHTDACQAGNLLSLDVKKLGVDMMTINSGKVYGPIGVACLYKKFGVRIEPVTFGGEQENNLRAGTENLPLIVGFTEALHKSQNLREKEYKRMKVLEEYFIENLKEKVPGIIFNGHPKNKIPSTVHVSVPFIEGESAILMLDSYGIRASTGSACSAFDLRPSHVLLAIGQNPDLVHGSIRFSFGRYTTKKDLSYVLEIFPQIINKLRSISALTIQPHEAKN